MSKFRVKLKLQGLELELEGSREDAPAMAQQLSRQFAGLLQPAAQLAAGGVDEAESVPATVVATTPAMERTARGARRPRKRRVATTSTNGGAAASDGDEPLTWRHDPAVWGAPLQPWSTAQKAIWLVYVAGQNTDTKELTSGQITATFNKHFKSSGLILKHNLTRDLSKLKGKPPVVISEDTSADPPLWFLTNSGIEYAKQLVTEAKGGPAASTSDAADTATVGA